MKTIILNFQSNTSQLSRTYCHPRRYGFMRRLMYFTCFTMKTFIASHTRTVVATQTLHTCRSIDTGRADALINLCNIQTVIATTIVNILFMAPRMVYFSMIYLLWSILVEASTTFRPVDYGP